MPAFHQVVDQRLVLGGKTVLERSQVLGPLLERARPGQYRRDDAVIEHPVERKLPCAHAALFGVRLECLRDGEGLLAELGLHHALVFASCARVRGGCLARRIFAGEHAARERTVRHHTQAVAGAGRQDLGFRHAVHRIVDGLAYDRRGYTQLVAQFGNLRDAPGAVVRDAKIARLAGADDFPHGDQRLLDRCGWIVEVQIVDVDPVRVQAPQARVDGAHHPAARQAGFVRPLAHGIADLGRHHPLLAVARNQLAGDAFGLALGVLVRGVDEVDPGGARRFADAARFGGVGTIAEHHRAEANG